MNITVQCESLHIDCTSKRVSSISLFSWRNGEGGIVATIAWTMGGQKEQSKWVMIFDLLESE